MIEEAERTSAAKDMKPMIKLLDKKNKKGFIYSLSCLQELKLILEDGQLN